MDVLYFLLIIIPVLLIVALFVWIISGLLGIIIMSKRVYGKYFYMFKIFYLERCLTEVLWLVFFGIELLRFSLKPNLRSKLFDNRFSDKTDLEG